MVVAAPHAGRPWRRRATRGRHVLPNVKGLNLEPAVRRQDSGGAQRSRRPKFTGFWFHAQNDVDFATVPYKWEGHTRGHRRLPRRNESLVRVITRRLSEIRPRLEERKREAEEEQKLLARVVKSSTSTAVLGSWTPGGEYARPSTGRTTRSYPRRLRIACWTLPCRTSRQFRWPQPASSADAECDAILMVRANQRPGVRDRPHRIGRNDRARYGT